MVLPETVEGMFMGAGLKWCKLCLHPLFGQIIGGSAGAAAFHSCFCLLLCSGDS